MPNQKLIGRKIVFPKQLLQRMREITPNGFSTQLNNFINRGYVVTHDLENVVKEYPNLEQQDKISHGGDIFYNWALSTLNTLRTRVKDSKKNTSSFKPNTYIKAHVKGGETRSTPINEIKTVRITEQTFKKIKNGYNLF
jgi:hypothetical protein